MFTATVAAGAAPADADRVSKTTIAAPTVPVTESPVTTTAITAVPLPTTPPGAMRVTDDTRRVTVLVPDTWTDASTYPAMSNDGGDRPRIVASPDVDAMNETWTTPGLWMNVLPPSADPADWLVVYTFGSSCTPGTLTTVNDGRFVGATQTWTNCGGGTAQIVQFAARSADGTFGVYAQIQTVTSDDPAIAMVLESVGLVPGATMTPPTIAAGPISTVRPADPTLVSAAVPADAIRVVDDTGRYALSVPATWADTTTFADGNDDGSNRPSIDAAPDMDAYIDRWDAAGLSSVLLPYVDPAIYLNNRTYGTCTDGGLQPIATATHSGLVRTWTGCGGTATRVLEMAITPADLSSTFVLYVQLVDADNTPLAIALASFQLV